MNEEGFLQVKTYTWDKETHGLFDYDSKLHCKKNVFNLSGSRKIFRNNHDCYVENLADDEFSLGLVKIEKKPSEFLVSSINSDSYNKMWLVIRKLPKASPPGYKLREGDWLRFGRIQLKVLKICLESEKTSNNFIPQFFSKNSKQAELIENVSEILTEKTACRICLSDSETFIDPLISPCKCAGSMKFVHLNCLKEWLRSKITSKVSPKGMSFHLRDLTCELCRSSFPLLIPYKEQKISLLSFEPPSSSYLILEEYRPDNNARNALHFITLKSKESVQLGRGLESDIKISDISVSRKHCKISRHADFFFIEDLESKFGTLVKVKKSFLVKPKFRLTIQISRTVLKLNYKVPWTLKDLCKCCSSEKVRTQSYSHLTQPDVHDSEGDLDSSQVHLAGVGFS